MKDNLYKIVVLEESELLFGGSVKVSFPDDSAMGKLIVTRGRNQGVVAINLVDLCEQPEPPDYVIRPGNIHISLTRRTRPPDSRIATEEEFRAAIRQALVTYVMPGETHWMLRDKKDAKQPQTTGTTPR
jgi:hypothetical protein